MPSGPSSFCPRSPAGVPACERNVNILNEATGVKDVNPLWRCGSRTPQRAGAALGDTIGCARVDSHVRALTYFNAKAPKPHSGG